MPSDFFLAQTGAEIQQNLPFGAKKAWMGFQFSLCSTGLANFPRTLPPGSMLIVTDQVPVRGHDSGRVCEELQQVVKDLQCSRVLLDFQRPENPETAVMARAITQALPCPVGVSQLYAAALDCPVCLPPSPLAKTLAAYTGPWQGRQIWLEMAPDCAAYRITAEGCQAAPCSPEGRFPHSDRDCFCRYRIELQEDAAVFTLCRGWEDFQRMMADSLIECFVGLYQEFAQPEAQSTALDQ